MRELLKALVTGATRGPGRALAAGLATAGYETYALGRDRVVLEELRSDFGIIPMAMDLTDREAVRLIVDGMRPDILVHAALRWPAEARFLDLTEADLDMALEVNLSATLYLTRAVLPAMRERQRGAVVVVSPAATRSAALLEKTVAGASEAFAAALQPELAGCGVSVRSLSIGEAPFAGLVDGVLSILNDANIGLGASAQAIQNKG